LIWTDAGSFGAAGAGAISAGLSLGSGFADEVGRCGLTAVSTAGLNEGAIADGGTSGISAGGLGIAAYLKGQERPSVESQRRRGAMSEVRPPEPTPSASEEVSKRRSGINEPL